MDFIEGIEAIEAIEAIEGIEFIDVYVCKDRMLFDTRA